jgi:methyl-accepting chemotaxis protein
MREDIMSEIKNRFGFGTKILVLVLASSIGLAVISSAIALKLYVGSYHSFIDMYKKSLYADFDISAKSEVELSISMLQKVSDRQQKGELSLEDAKKQGADLLRALRYGKDGYFWADTADGTNVVHATVSSFEGKNRIELKDHKNNYFMKDIINNGRKEGGGFSDYWFPKKGSDVPLQKRAYSLEFKPWGWIVGTGNYVDDLDEMVKKAADESMKNLRQGIYLIIGVTVALIIIISIVSIFVTRKLLHHIGTEPAHLAEITHQVAAGDLTYRFELDKGGVYEAMRQMVEQGQQKFPGRGFGICTAEQQCRTDGRCLPCGCGSGQHCGNSQ